jgi:hypothetical protein
MTLPRDRRELEAAVQARFQGMLPTVLARLEDIAQPNSRHTACARRMLEEHGDDAQRRSQREPAG